jgi:hypothetical protein
MLYAHRVRSQAKEVQQIVVVDEKVARHEPDMRAMVPFSLREILSVSLNGCRAIDGHTATRLEILRTFS